MSNTLSLSGLAPEFAVTITPAAVLQRTSALELSAGVVAVTNATEQQDAIAAASLLKSLIKGMEATREEVKAPVLAAGKLIDRAAKDYADALRLELARVEGLASSYQADLNRRAEALRQDELRKLAAEAETRPSLDDARDRAARVAELSQPLRVAGATVKTGNDYEVMDIGALYTARPDLVAMEPRRASILAAINIPNAPDIPGLRVFEVTKVQARA